MKKYILITLVFSLIGLLSFSQQKNITGPKAKNSYGKKDDCDTYHFMPVERTIVKGPKFKNQHFKNLNTKKEDLSFFTQL
tara:strand:- start:9349 stop:9588 length:240 start_codon:yes stop_codon:yes gene_type:complete